MDDLIKLGLITFKNEEYVKTGKRFFEKEVILDLLKKLEGKIKPPAGGASGQITFSQVLAMGKNNEILSIGKMVKLILEDTIVPRWKGEGVGLNSLLFDKIEINSFIKHQNNDRIKGYLTTNDVSRLLKVKNSCVNLWVKLGLLESFKLESTSYGKLFIPDKVKDFMDRHVTITELRMKNTFGTKISAGKLMKLGLRPVTGPTIDGGKTYLFIREDVNRILRQVIDF